MICAVHLGRMSAEPLSRAVHAHRASGLYHQELGSLRLTDVNNGVPVEGVGRSRQVICPIG